MHLWVLISNSMAQTETKYIIIPVGDVIQSVENDQTAKKETSTLGPDYSQVCLLSSVRDTKWKPVECMFS